MFWIKSSAVAAILRGLLILSFAVMVPNLQAANPVPLVNWPVTPMTVAPAGAGFTLTVNGTGFVAGSVVRWNGSPRPTTFVSSSKLTAAIPATDIAHSTTALITVFSPSPGGGSSNVVFFQVRRAGIWPAFGTPVHYNTGAAPESVVTGDFNGDHKLDLAVANPNSNNVSILAGNGDGTFKPAVEYSVGQAPISAAVGDLNHDGKLDLVVANSASNNVSVLLGNGDGTFRTAVEHSTGGTNPAGLVLADFNRDGNLDAVVMNTGSNNISVLLGNGAGSFQSPKTYAVGQNPAGIAVGDFNRDGKLDLAIANNYSNSISILLGNGDGTFRTPVNYSGITNAGSIVTADFNGDGNLDLLVANSLGFYVSVLLGNGDGTFQGPTSYNTGYEPSPALGDLNGDGKLDLAVANVGQNEVNTLLGNGTGGFQQTVGYFLSFGPWSATVGDFNGDGKLDIAVPDGGPGISILLQTQPLAGPNATLSSTAIRFECRYAINAGCQCVTAAYLTVSNYGSQTLDLTGMTVTGPFSSGFGCNRTLPAGRFCNIPVRWLESKGSGSGALTLFDSAVGSPQVVTLSGEKFCNPFGASDLGTMDSPRLP